MNQKKQTDLKWKKTIQHLFNKTRIALRYGYNALIFAIKIFYFKIAHKRSTIICCFANPNTVGGAESLFKLIAEDLKEKKQLTVVITTGFIHQNFANPIIQELKNHGIFHIHAKGLERLNYSKHHLAKQYLSFLFRSLGSPIIHLFNPGCLFLIPSAKRAGMKVVYHEMGLPSNNEWWNPLISQINEIDHVISVSSIGLSLLRTLFDYQGAGTIIHSVIEPPPTDCKSRMPEEGVLNLIYFGNVFEGKGVDILLKAFALILPSHPYATLTIIGQGPDLMRIKKLSQTLNLEKKVRFLGFLERKKMFNEMIRSDIFCLPSFSEGCPCSIIEAMSIALPTIATRVGGIPEIIIDQETGVLVQPKEVNALSEAILRLASDFKLRIKIKTKAFYHYNQLISREKGLKALINVYTTLGSK